MTIHVVQRYLLVAETDAILLTMDGSRPGLEGGIARTFAQQHPKAWTTVMKQVTFPIALGDTDAASAVLDLT